MAVPEAAVGGEAVLEAVDAVVTAAVVAIAIAADAVRAGKSSHRQDLRVETQLAASLPFLLRQSSLSVRSRRRPSSLADSSGKLTEACRGRSRQAARKRR